MEAVLELTLLQKQQIFTANVATLIPWVRTKGWGCTFGEAYRTPEQAQLNALKGTGISNSLHTQRLAVDLCLYIGGVYQKYSSAYQELGTYWKSLHPLNRWGGDFKDKLGQPKPDGNHFSMEHNGVK